MKKELDDQIKLYDEQQRKILKMKDDQMDNEARNDRVRDKEKFFEEEMIALKDQLSGKDQAIKVLGQTLMEKASEHEKMSEMFNNFKNKLITENCFHINYGAKRHVVMPGVLQNKVNIEEVVISFMRDRTFEEEFFLVIESKEINEKTGCKDKILIPVDDIDEIEHTEGLKFEVHY